MRNEAGKAHYNSARTIQTHGRESSKHVLVEEDENGFESLLKEGRTAADGGDLPGVTRGGRPLLAECR